MEVKRSKAGQLSSRANAPWIKFGFGEAMRAPGFRLTILALAYILVGFANLSVRQL